MSTHPLTPDSSRKRLRFDDLDPDLIELAQERSVEAAHAQEVAQRLFTKNPPASPPPSLPRLPPIPPTPCKKLRTEKAAFPGETLPRTNDPTSINIERSPVSFGVVYTANGRKHNLLKQPMGSKSCWAYSLVMLLSDLIRSEKLPQAKLNTSFWEWFQKAYLLDAESVQTQAQNIGVELELTEIPFEDPLGHIRNQIERSGFPVLISIDHPDIGGHAIVIDSINGTHTTIRDPYSGMAWKVPNEQMKSHYSESNPEEEIEFAEKQKCLSVKPS